MLSRLSRIARETACSMAVGSCGINIRGLKRQNAPFSDFGSCTVGSHSPAKRCVPNCFLYVSPGWPGLQGNVDDVAKFATGGSARSLNGHSLNHGYDVTREAGGGWLCGQIAIHPRSVQALAKRGFSGHTTRD